MLKKTKEEINKISPTICLAKWFWVTMHIGMESNHSCYHPQIHSWDLDECKKDPQALHNTKHKKEVRKMMLEGQQPEECKYCWNIENLNDKVYSDRILMNHSNWAFPYVDKIKNTKWNENIYPTYLEISFSNLCNFACSYCSPGQSSVWEKDVSKNGSYPVKDPTVQKGNLHNQLKEDKNPYIKIFWKWFEEAYKHLKVLRVTGGEPLITDSFFKMVDFIESNESNDISLFVNTNLGYSSKINKRLIEKSKSILPKVEKISIFTSIDTWGSQAEYIRDGLKLEKFETNLIDILKEKTFDIVLMVTFGVFSIFNYKEFVKKTVEWKSIYNNILVTPALLTNPTHFNVNILTKEFKPYFDDVDEYIKELYDKEIYSLVEYNAWKVMYNYFLENMDKEFIDEKKDLINFVKEYDKRRNKNFKETFPELKNFLGELYV